MHCHMLLFTLQLTLKYLNCTNGGVSFNSRINELQSRLTMQVGELKQWQNLANSEAEMRWQAEKKINELERII